MTETQIATIEKYVSHYPHLQVLATQAKNDKAARKALGDQIGRLAVPPNVSGSELLEVSKLGVE
jgi:hypothetical protein